MVELIAWDPGKQVFNFYELIGNGEKGEWLCIAKKPLKHLFRHKLVKTKLHKSF